MTPILRGLLILIVISINLIIFFNLKRRKVDISYRCYSYLRLQSILFPVIDLSMNMFGSSHTCLGVSSLFFVLINFDIFRYINWRHHILIIVLISIMILSAILSQNIINSLLSIPGYLIGFIVYISAYIAFSSEEISQKQYIYKLFKYPIIYVLAWGLIQIFFTPKFSLYYSVWFKEVRISSCFLDPQTAGIGIATLFILVWNYLQNSNRNLSIILCILLFCIGCFTGSKIFFIGIISGLIVSLFFNKYKSKLFILVCSFMIIAIISFNYWIDFPVFERLLKINKSLDQRQDIFWVYGIDIFKNNWFSGIGPGNFEKYIETLKIPLQHFVNGKYFYASQPESGYLLWLDEYGVMSFIWILIIGYVMIKKGNYIVNISVLIPWMVGFVSVYAFVSMHIVFLIFLIAALIVKHKTVTYS